MSTYYFLKLYCTGLHLVSNVSKKRTLYFKYFDNAVTKIGLQEVEIWLMEVWRSTTYSKTLKALTRAILRTPDQKLVLKKFAKNK